MKGVSLQPGLNSPARFVKPGFQFYVALWSDKPLRVIEKEKFRYSGEPFCSERNLVTRKGWPGNQDYMVNFQPG